jgi:hypothetical protein
MTNLECAIAVLALHREERRWTDEAVAADLLAKLDIDPAAEAAHAVVVAGPVVSEDEVIAAEAAAKEAADKALATREAFEAQSEAHEVAPPVEEPAAVPHVEPVEPVHPVVEPAPVAPVVEPVVEPAGAAPLLAAEPVPPLP